jgi:hypothetical protein
MVEKSDRHLPSGSAGLSLCSLRSLAAHFRVRAIQNRCSTSSSPTIRRYSRTYLQRRRRQGVSALAHARRTARSRSMSMTPAARKSLRSRCRQPAQLLHLAEPIHVHGVLLNLPVRQPEDADACHRHRFAIGRMALVLGRLRGARCVFQTRQRFWKQGSG